MYSLDGTECYNFHYILKAVKAGGVIGKIFREKNRIRLAIRKFMPHAQELSFLAITNT